MRSSVTGWTQDGSKGQLFRSLNGEEIFMILPLTELSSGFLWAAAKCNQHTRSLLLHQLSFFLPLHCLSIYLVLLCGLSWNGWEILKFQQLLLINFVSFICSSPLLRKATEPQMHIVMMKYNPGKHLLVTFPPPAATIISVRTRRFTRSFSTSPTMSSPPCWRKLLLLLRAKRPWRGRGWTQQPRWAAGLHVRLQRRRKWLQFIVWCLKMFKTNLFTLSL